MAAALNTAVTDSSAVLADRWNPELGIRTRVSPDRGTTREIRRLTWSGRCTLNQPYYRHHPSGDATGQHTTGKAHHQHDDAGVVLTEYKLVDFERAQKDPQQSSRQFLVADLGFS